ncbi:MAG: PVC-type heme-binding CxxCH protein [Verrucomicrobiota bacterium]
MNIARYGTPFALLVALSWISLVPAAAQSALTAADPNIKITLFAEHPDVVTPTGVAVDPSGRVFIAENNTHHRPDDYPGHPTDRILIFEDTTGDGKADKQTLFNDDLSLTTDLIFDDAGNLYVSTRSQIYRFDNAANQRESKSGGTLIVDMVTENEYPHNGISGLSFSPDGKLHFGLGENHGSDYAFTGTDLSGSDEGGATFRCNLDGSGLEQLSTGHWNAFGTAFDLNGNFFATENDPSSSPPNRLLHIVPGADFGYEYRYGRSGLHPLVCWFGEHPGTLGMVAGTGEAACGIIPFGPNKLLVASWADHRVDLFDLTQKGASFDATRTPFITGPNDFRPVHMAYTPDHKTLYLTDWVSASYPVHGQGRVWKIDFPEPIDLTPVPPDPAPELSFEEHLTNLASDDPYVATAAINALKDHPEKLLAVTVDTLPEPRARARARLAVALKRSKDPAAQKIIPSLLKSNSPKVRFAAIKWIADEKLTPLRSQLEDQLKRPDLSVDMFLATMAALQTLDGEKPTDVPRPDKLLAIVDDETKSPEVRALSLRLIPPHYPKLNLDRLRSYLHADDPALQLEAIRTLQAHPDEGRELILSRIAGDKERPPLLRAEAILGLATAGDGPVQLLTILYHHEDPVIAAEAQRALIGVGGNTRALDQKPPFTDTDAWEKLINDVPGEPDLENGRRIFFNPKIGTCSRCHQMEGRGTRVGPDLTTISESGDQRWLLSQLLNPNADLAPQFMPWRIVTKDGASHIGLPLRKGGTREAYLGADGKEFALNKTDIVEHEELSMSLMPAGLLSPLSPEEIRDLFAYILEPKDS